VTTLEKGHCDPRRPLTDDNCIPMCKLCNMVYKDNAVLNRRGFVIHWLATRAQLPGSGDGGSGDDRASPRSGVRAQQQDVTGSETPRSVASTWDSSSSSDDISGCSSSHRMSMSRAPAPTTATSSASAEEASHRPARSFTLSSLIRSACQHVYDASRRLLWGGPRGGK
jgi:hypothetical protein